jgi:hypothetical protein
MPFPNLPGREVEITVKAKPGKRRQGEVTEPRLHV